VGLSTGFIPEPLEALALMAIIAAAWLTSAKADGWAFVATAVGIGGTVGSIFTELFPRVMISTTNTAYNLTVDNTASPPYTLKVMTVVAVVLLPVVVVYQAWAYHVFKARLAAPKFGGGDSASPADVVTGGDVAAGPPAQAT
jgi:cytochrome d ubiquinol oxidase subunit II